MLSARSWFEQSERPARLPAPSEAPHDRWWCVVIERIGEAPVELVRDWSRDHAVSHG